MPIPPQSQASLSQQNLNKLQLAQNIACRIILKCGNREHITNIHEELKLEYLNNRRDKHLAIECHKNIHGKVYNPLKKIFKLKANTNNRRTRRGCQFDVEIPRVNSNIGRKAISFTGPQTWNRLKRELKEISNFNSFKSKLKKIEAIFDNHPT